MTSNTSPEEEQQIRIIFTAMGYPLTSTVLGSDRVTEGDASVAEMAESNRADLLPLIAKLPAQLGLTSSWYVDATEFERHYPDDAERIVRAFERR